MHSRSLPRVAVVGAAALALAGALWFAFRDSAAPAPDAATALPRSVVQPVDVGEPVDDAPATRAAEVAPTLPAASEVADDEPVRASTSSPAITETATGATAGLDAAGPPTEPGVANGSNAAEAPASVVPATLDFALDERDLTDGGARGDAPSVVVPSSYPVTDAAKYFVPREERRPGNLGGPPPLDFPGGPGDPANGPSDPFEPPAAPGG